MSSLGTWFTDWGAPKLRCLYLGSSRIVTVHPERDPSGRSRLAQLFWMISPLFSFSGKGSGFAGMS